uniref:uncharacterized protein LOC122610328 n=1 Tax=Erigeron canadensis TaxID=72917 RepID=UPI001CB99EB0|nr:uncharacterized protein LOC122610328 [Erigeron canadensis]
MHFPNSQTIVAQNIPHYALVHLPDCYRRVRKLLKREKGNLRIDEYYPAVLECYQRRWEASSGPGITWAESVFAFRRFNVFLHSDSVTEGSNANKNTNIGAGLASKVKKIDGKVPAPIRGILKNPKTTSGKNNTSNSDKTTFVHSPGGSVHATVRDVNLSNRSANEVNEARKEKSASGNVSSEYEKHGYPKIPVNNVSSDVNTEFVIPAKVDYSGSAPLKEDRDKQANGAAAAPVGKDNNNNKSYASMVNSGSQKQQRPVNFRFLETSEQQEDVDIVLPREAIRKVQDKYDNTLFGYFLGKRIAFPVGKNFVTNNWGKHGLQRIMMNANGFFFFKFSNSKGLKEVLEGGPWIVRNSPIFLNVWTPSTILKKEELKNVVVWVKIHNVPLAAYSDDGLSMLASKIGKPKMLDSYTTTMCNESWGRSSFARAMIEILADQALKDELKIAIPIMEEEGFVKESMRVEYEWKPPRCASCCIFGHSDAQCPQNVKVYTKGSDVDSGGFKEVKGKRKAKQGVPIKQHKTRFEYRPVNKNDTTSVADPSSSESAVKTSNAYELLSDFSEGVNEPVNTAATSSEQRDKPKASTEDEDDDEVEVIWDESAQYMASNTKPNNSSEGASTPGLDGFNGKVFRSWDWTSNGNVCDKGTRIIMGWNTDVVDVMVIAQSDQVMHNQVIYKLDNKSFFCSFVYVANHYKQRRDLWADLCKHKCFAGDNPWVLLGDFNSALFLEDSFFGSSCMSIGVHEFKECVQNIEVMDINSSGFHYTWTHKPKHGSGVLKKIDRVMGNIQFCQDFPSSHAIFQPYRTSDHSPCILKLPNVQRDRPKPFKFANFLVHKKEFTEIVKCNWNVSVDCCKMYKVVKKLKTLKHPIRSLLYKQGNLHERVTKLRIELDQIQKTIDLNPSDERSRELETERTFTVLSKLNIIQVESCRLRIDTGGVAKALVAHYEAFLGTNSPETQFDPGGVFNSKLTSQKALDMVKNVTDDEIKAAMFSIGDNKAPGPDGFSSLFFKKSWDIVGGEVSNAIHDFFKSGRLLGEVNHTFLALIPKVTTPSMVTDYRPISCCNVLYKCISKIITDRIKDCLDDIVGINQSAFIPGRRISNNILLTQELMHNYHRNVGPPRCAFKVDIQKAYDTVDWKFLRAILEGFGFHQVMVNWIMTCVTSVSFSLSINGNIHGFFKGKRG